jgi:hypothetical protein
MTTCVPDGTTARPQGAALDRGPSGRSVGRHQQRCSRGVDVGITYDDFIRTPAPARCGDAPAGLRGRRHRTDSYEGLYRRLRALPRKTSSTADARSTGPVEPVGGELLLQALRLRGSADCALRRAPGGRTARDPPERDPRADPAGPARLLDEQDVDLVGHPAAVGRAPRRLRVVRRTHQLLHCGGLPRRPCALRRHWR